MFPYSISIRMHTYVNLYLIYNQIKYFLLLQNNLYQKSKCRKITYIKQQPNKPVNIPSLLQ